MWVRTLGLCSRNLTKTDCPFSCNACGPCVDYPCPSDQKCVYNSSLLNAWYTCVCADDYTGGPCAESPCVGVTSCLNGGTCLVDPTSPDGYRCLCMTGYTGSHCQDCSDDLGVCGDWARQNQCSLVYVENYCRVSCPLGCPRQYD
ncbi:uncharacterized protein LOC143290075 [Babylonia areolata]|uniref:uncharacterized protein LOC143290075 n=1 Tax=Babylonia areolata TaxID=304850 RepID=UPI003FD41802